MSGFKPSLILTKKQIEYIDSLKFQFARGERLTGVPWRAIAAIWSRESFSVASPKTPGGPFQFDPPLSKLQITNLLKRYTKLPDIEIAAYAVKGVNDFETALLCCACWLRQKCTPVLTSNSPDADIKDAMYGYNGRVYGSADKSPYVMNGYSPKHMGKDGQGMVLVGSIPDGQGGRKQIRIVDKRPGAFTVYNILKSEVL